MCALLLGSISPVSTAPHKASPPINVQEITPVKKRSQSVRPALYSYMSSPSEAINYLLGYRQKTKRSLAEEAECGDETSVCSWIRDGCDPNELDAYGYTPLLNAAALGRLNAVVELIKNGADINKVGPFGFTPIHAAAQVRISCCFLGFIKYRFLISSLFFSYNRMATEKLSQYC
jgi:hypothetical protein